MHKNHIGRADAQQNNPIETTELSPNINGSSAIYNDDYVEKERDI